MNDASRPVAVRVIRPYLSEDDYLANEGDSITKTTIELIGAHSRPTGIILRFEVTLETGKTLIRGEGRVTQFNEHGRDNLPSLSLRFTKLDPKSKALIDRAVMMRQPQQASAQPGAPGSAPNITAEGSAPQLAAPGSGPEITPGSIRPDANERSGDDDAETPAPAQASPASDTDAPTASPTDTVAPPTPESSGNDTVPPPTPLVMLDPASLDRGSDADDPDPEGDAVTATPPAVGAATVPPSRPPPSIGAPSAGPYGAATVPPEAAATTPPAAPSPSSQASPPASASTPASGSTPASNGAEPTTARGGDRRMSEPPPTRNFAAPNPDRRDALLARLRERGRALAPERIADIVKPRARGGA